MTLTLSVPPAWRAAAIRPCASTQVRLTQLARNRIVCDFVRQTIGAQQQTVARPHRLIRDIYIEGGIAAHGPRYGMPSRRVAVAVRNVVIRQLAQFVVAQSIEPAVTHPQHCTTRTPRHECDHRAAAPRRFGRARHPRETDSH